MRAEHLVGWAIALVVVLMKTSLVGTGVEVSQFTAQDDVRTTRLVEAVKVSDISSIRAQLEGGADVNAPEPDGTTALHWAAHHGTVEVVDLLLAAGADVTVATRYGVTPLILACENGDAGVIERMLKAGADANLALPSGQTPLMTAARNGKANALEVLLAHGADVHAREPFRGQTALMWAATHGYPAAVEALMAGGADVSVKSRGPATPVAGLDIYARPSRVTRLDEFSALLFAIQAGKIDASRVLIEWGANVNDKAPDGTSALVLAIANGHYELAAFLLDQRADPNAAEQGWNALVQVVRTKNPSIGQAPFLVTTGRMSPRELAEKLIAHGVDVDARITQRIRDRYRTHMNMVGATAYIMAAKAADAEMMRLLLAAGADPWVQTEAGRTASMVAAGIDMWYVDEDSGTTEDALEAVQVALDAGTDVNAINEDGDTALHGAAFRGSNEMVQLLVDRGAELDVENNAGFTPLMIANGDQRISCNLQRRPQTVELLTKLMTERGLSARVRSLDEKYGSGLSLGNSNRPPSPPECDL